MTLKALFEYTTDYETDAIETIKDNINETGLKCTNIIVKEANRACRNAYGKELDPDEFDAIDPDSDEAWFDDYDFTLEATIESDLPLSEIKNCLEDISEFTEIVTE